MTDHPSPLADASQSEALRLIERAEQAVDDLCSGKLRWEMRVPAEPNHDPDLIISTALRAAKSQIIAARSSEPPASPAPDYSHRRHKHMDDVSCADAGEAGHPPYLSESSPAPRICPDCHEPIVDASHWHEDRGPAPLAPASPDEPSTLPVSEAIRKHRPTVYTGAASDELIRCECGHRDHPAGWFAHLSVEVAEKAEREARAASASVPPPLAFEIRSVAAAMLRGEHICDRRHKSEHVHFDDVHRWGQRLAFALNAAEAPEQEP